MKTARLACIVASVISLPSLLHAATIGIGNNEWYTPTLQNNLVTQGHSVSVVETYDAVSLSAFDVYIQDGNSHFDNSALLDFVSNGGILIQIPWSQNHYSLSSELAVMTESGDSNQGANPAITANDSSNWLLTGVTLPSAGSYNSRFPQGHQFASGSTAVLSWADGENTALLGYKEYGDGIVISFNQHLVTDDSQPIDQAWSNQIVFNAVDRDTLQVPEPSSALLIALGAIAAVGRRKR
ncbi:PEP-CTERM sorting domain-containing protein [Luteolibacter sp. Populi]|uniref:PEP-CTERM sorting domain-containing protein n=1 Tax=Luteolibacter sp. Populi TaxID=3230487 RepID=UPI003465BDAB